MATVSSMNTRLVLFALIFTTAVLLDYFIPTTFFLRPVKMLILLVVVPLLLIGKSLKNYGLQLGDVNSAINYFLLIFAIALPIMLFGAALPSFRHYYPLWKPAALSISNFLLYSFVIAVQMFACEFFFRGFVLFELRNHFGNSAILLQSIPYMLVHVGKPTLELYYSFFAGLVFGYIDLKSGSILPSFLVHFICSTIFDILVILQLP